MILYSAPATFTLPVTPSSYTVTFAIPAGVYTSASWSAVGAWTLAGIAFLEADIGADTQVLLPGHGVSGSYTDTRPLSAGQLTDLNAAVGGTLTVTLKNISGGGGGSITVYSFALTLVGSGGSTISTEGVVIPSDVITKTDTMATYAKQTFATLGIGAPSEVTTLAALAIALENKVMGDGGGNPGLASADLKASLRPYIKANKQAGRADVHLATYMKPYLLFMETNIKENLPPGWTWIGGSGAPLVSGGATRLLDALLLYANACNPYVPPAPGGTGVLTGVNDGNGTLSASMGGSPHFVFCYVGSTDYYVSLPCADIQGPALTLAQNAFNWDLSGLGAVPTPGGGALWTITKGRIYRGFFNAALGTYYLTPVVDFPLVSGGAHPNNVRITQRDESLRTDWTPPAWASAFLVPPAATAIALTSATLSSNDKQSTLPMQYNSLRMVSPYNVCLDSTLVPLGLGNPETAGIFYTRDLGVSTTAGTIQAANVGGPANLQGFIGSLNGLQLRVLTSPNGTINLTVTYHYYDAVHGYGSIQTATANVVVPNAAAINSVVQAAITAGRVVIGVTGDAVTGGTATTGKYQWEGVAPRMY